MTPGRGRERDTVFVVRATEEGGSSQRAAVRELTKYRLGHMAITEAHAGRRYPPTTPYAVSAAKIAEFAAALGDGNPAYSGKHPLAPPTFAAVLSAPAWQQMFDDPELDLALSQIVHGDQRFAFRDPLRAGDVVQAILTIDKVRVRAGTEIISSSVVIAGVDGTERCTATATFVHARGAAA